MWIYLNVWSLFPFSNDRVAGLSPWWNWLLNEFTHYQPILLPSRWFFLLNSMFLILPPQVVFIGRYAPHIAEVPGLGRSLAHHLRAIKVSFRYFDAMVHKWCICDLEEASRNVLGFSLSWSINGTWFKTYLFHQIVDITNLSNLEKGHNIKKYMVSDFDLLWWLSKDEW